MNTIDRCREFYLNEITSIIHDRFAEYEGRIAAGLAGEGSECFGYDDEISSDHDFGISVCLWLADEDYESIGTELDAACRSLIQETGGIHEGTRLEYRRGVQRISDFYRKLLGFDFDMDTPHMTDGQWFFAEDWRLAAATNGEVFRDELGYFTAVREMLAGHYPDRVFRMKLANSLHGYAGAWQANYPRCMARNDIVAANACINIGIEEAIRIVFLLKKRYMPYYKWAYRALRELADSADTSDADCRRIKKIADFIEAAALKGPQPNAWLNKAYDAHIINTDDETVVLSEKIAEIIVEMLAERGLIESCETFLEAHCDQVASSLHKH